MQGFTPSSVDQIQKGAQGEEASRNKQRQRAIQRRKWGEMWGEMYSDCAYRVAEDYYVDCDDEEREKVIMTDVDRVERNWP